MTKKNLSENPSTEARKSKIVLLLIDVISDFQFEDGEALFENALPAAKRIAALKKRAAGANIPVVYINDNFGNWRDDFRQTIKHCEQNSECGKEIVDLLKPDEQDFFVLKPKHSAFYLTPLDLLLEELGAENLIITGFSTDICVMFTANDAYMRGYNVFIPRDCVAAVKRSDTEYALKFVERVLDADTSSSEELDLKNLNEEKP